MATEDDERTLAALAHIFGPGVLVASRIVGADRVIAAVRARFAPDGVVRPIDAPFDIASVPEHADTIARRSQLRHLEEVETRPLAPATVEAGAEEPKAEWSPPTVRQDETAVVFLAMRFNGVR